ncbi:MAG TPA: hypothetical protein VKZ53_19595 [Candidatus Angelobacter sp.]|nr:hypothetical protein [Candidatus Angelobacter sp.]
MRHISVISAFLFLLLPWGAQPQFELRSGVVEGEVVDELGNPVPRIMVDIRPDFAMGYSGAIPVRRIWTGLDGHFVIRDVPSGAYVFYAVDPERDYIDSRDDIGMQGFYGDPSTVSTKVRVKAGQLVNGIIVPAKHGGKLRMSVVDSETGQPVPASIRLVRPDMETGGIFMTNTNLKGVFQIVLPSIPFRLEVRVADYETWRYSDTDILGNHSSELLLRPGIERRLTVKLQKKNLSVDSHQ